MLTTFENWNERGITDCHFSPIQTYNHPGDKHAAYYKRLESAAGDNYFVSFPPFTFMFTYGIFKLFHVNPDRLSIQLLNMFLHLVSAVFVYLIVFNYYNKKESLKLALPALTAFVLYLFIPVLLYEHIVVYFPELLGHVWWIIALYFTMKWFQAEDAENRKRQAIYTSILIFFMTYTEWIGIFYSVVLILLLYYQRSIEKRQRIFLIRTVAISSVSALALMIIQYSSIAGIKNLLRALAIRYAERSGAFNEAHSDQGLNFFNSDSYLRFGINLNSVLFPFGYLLLLAVLLIVFRKGFRDIFNAVKSNKQIIVLSVLPALLHVLIFFNSAIMHRHCVAFLGLPLALSAGFFVHWLLNNYKSVVVTAGVLIVLLFSAISTKLYFDKHFYLKVDYSFLTSASEIIKKNSADDEVVMLNIKTELSNPLAYISFMSKRNMVYAKDTIEVRQKLQNLNKEKAVYYQFDSPLTEFVLYRLTLEKK